MKITEDNIRKLVTWGRQVADEGFRRASISGKKSYRLKTGKKITAPGFYALHRFPNDEGAVLPDFWPCEIVSRTGKQITDAAFLSSDEKCFFLSSPPSLVLDDEFEARIDFAFIKRKIAERLTSAGTLHPHFMNRVVKCGQASMLPILDDPQGIQDMAVSDLSEERAIFLWGPPGTGKTEVVGRIIAEAVAKGRKVLMCAHTHKAVDVACVRTLKLSSPERRKEIVRLPVTRDEELATSVCKVPDPLAHRAIFATAYYSAMNLPPNWEPDLVVVDEISIMPPDLFALLLILFGDRLIFAGDPLQLPPVLEAQILESLENEETGGDGKRFFGVVDVLYGLDDSREWVTCNPQTFPEMRSLIHNRRSVETITSFVSKAVYGDRLLSLRPDVVGVDHLFWIDTRLLKPTSEYEKPFAGQGVSRGSRGNSKHVNFLVDLVRGLVKLGIQTSDLGIVTPYRHQSRLFRESLRISKLEEVKVGTVHQWQGDERALIFFDTCKAGRAEELGPLLQDDRLFNVAISRARDVLVIVADRFMMEKIKPFGATSLDPLFTRFHKLGRKLKTIESSVADRAATKSQFLERLAAGIRK